MADYSEYEKLRKEMDELLDANKKTAILTKFMATEDAAILPLELVKKLITTDEATTEANIALLKTTLATKPTGHTLKAGEKNPFKQGPDFNLTQQGKMLKENPDLARSLMAAERNY